MMRRVRHNPKILITLHSHNYAHQTLFDKDLANAGARYLSEGVQPGSPESEDRDNKQARSLYIVMWQRPRRDIF
jgi:hypothetical protein